MKKFTFILTVLIAMAITTNAQIPNNGFENWTTVGSYLEPQDYLTPNSFASTSFHPVTRSNDHYPVSIGNYSIRIESNTTLLPNADALGLVLQNTNSTFFDGPSPSFPIIGHPTSLKGYYKFDPLNGDSMRIQIQLTLNGSEVSYSVFFSAASASWTSFNIPIQTYTLADSGSILFASYNADGPPPDFIPHGNSVLYIDNLSFDNFISSVSEQTVKNTLFNLYPNPAFDIVNLNINNSNNKDLEINIYNIIGKLISSETLRQNQQQINIENLSNGIYMVEIKSKEWSEKQKLIIQR